MTLYKVHFSFIFGFHLSSFASRMTNKLPDVPAVSFITTLKILRMQMQMKSYHQTFYLCCNRGKPSSPYCWCLSGNPP